ncbi:hypothetical protein PIROE2DRAFT_17635 [Piromyces sp. E2]|nr:hypothetical protein PIROE2DRAFT_17635 [Piromyces sp. E2]|eukprot:OUM57402.1 hypothetical protein PIROE2DRAFT_17635 [Piromyces sp. E2]
MDKIENKVRTKVQDNDDNLKDVFEETIIDNIKNRYEDIIESTKDKYLNTQKYLEEAYERQIKLMNDKINVIIKTINSSNKFLLNGSLIKTYKSQIIMGIKDLVKKERTSTKTL